MENWDESLDLPFRLTEAGNSDTEKSIPDSANEVFAKIKKMLKISW